MAKVIEIDDAVHTPGLYDSANGASLTAARVVDITDDCPNEERTLLLYTAAKRGPIVQIVHPYDNEPFMGSCIHFFINELDEDVAPRDDSFGAAAKRAGLTRPQFRQLIEMNSPTA